MQRTPLKAWMEKSFVVHVSVWSCQQACPGRAAGVPVAASLTPTTAVTSVGTGATTPTTATGPALVHALAPGPGHVADVTALAPAAVATAGAAAGLHPIPGAEAGLDLLLAPSPGLLPGVVPDLALGPPLLPGGAPSPVPALAPRRPTTRGTVDPVPAQQPRIEARPRPSEEDFYFSHTRLQLLSFMALILPLCICVFG
ncbi:serine and arginine rich splicing factor 7a isoform X6 [Gouania willdenowi]|uniref:serine and arginine rich splicing factor 7a isoform X6 n=1 Tax=Gouania willdenowi TaxID=441366 RepID=UPI001056B3A2|nr:serine/arginine-rich splicing factor 7 isoform X6 [Gouania willdenowi]